MSVDHVLELEIGALQSSSRRLLVDVGACFAIAVVLVLAAADCLASVKLVASRVNVAAKEIARARKA